MNPDNVKGWSVRLDGLHVIAAGREAGKSLVSDKLFTPPFVDAAVRH